MSKTIGLCMIVKDEFEDFVSIYKSYKDVFDTFFVTVTSITQLDKFHEFAALCNKDALGKVNVSQFTWIKDFAAARNFNFQQADTDYIFWIDADDQIINANAIRSLIIDNPDVDMFKMTYIYSKDEMGNPNMVHPRERLLKNNKRLYWKGRVHETLIPIDDCQISYLFVPNIQINHLAKFEHNVESMERNLDILMTEYKEHGEETDPRTISYLATGLMTLERFDEAIKFFENHIKRSGWSEDIYLSWIGIAQCCRSLFVRKNDTKLLETAISADTEAALLVPNAPDAYLGLGESYVHMKDWAKVIEWTNVGMSKKPSADMPYTDPTRYTLRPLVSLAYAYLGMGNIDAAYNCIARANQINPKIEYVAQAYPFIASVKEDTDFFKSMITLAKYLEKNDKSLQKFIPSLIPSRLYKDDRFVRFANNYKEPIAWDKNSVVIFCGSTYEEWAAPSVVKGIGGSEEAVIYASKELTKLGYKVTVFCSCGDMEGEYEGVTYRNWWEFNPNDQYDTLIAWRGNIFTEAIRANNRLIWLHDVPFIDEYTAENTKNVDKILVLSEYHKSLLPNVPTEKIYLTTNGINVDDFIRADKKGLERNPKRIIYGSSYDRGLEHLLNLWPDIKKEVPDAELHVFYGWGGFDDRHKDNPSKQAWKVEMMKKLQQPGVLDHGRVGHRRLLEEYAKSGVWAYPTEFQEINCITAIKAQAMGCLPVYNNVYALKDTVHFGVGVTGTATREMLVKFRTALVGALKQPLPHYLEAEKDNIREQYSWKTLVSQWSKEMFPLSA